MELLQTSARVDAIAQRFAHVPGGLLPALHELQHEFGYVDPAAVPVLADVFNLSAAEVHGVVTFYADFRTTPPKGPVVQICRAEACQARGADAVVERARALVEGGAAIELADVFCLGNCALGPSAATPGQLHGGLDPDGVQLLISNVTTDHPATPVAPADTLDTNAVDTITVYVPRDAAARSAGADQVAAALSARSDVRVVRNGSRGMLWLEPMIEVATPEGRIAYGPVTAADVDDLLAGGVLTGAQHPLRLGPVDELPWLRRQHRVTFQRVGVVDPRSAVDHESTGGLVGLRRALSMTPADVIAEVTDSGLRGRGGAAFPTGIKWATVAGAPGDTKYIACNADEGDSGTFADRMLIEGDPLALIEGMVISGYAVGAHEGYVYVRSEYPDATIALHAAIQAATAHGWLGDDVLDSGFAFHVEVRVGAGAYICGEETAMLESMEGRRGMVRAKPPLPALEGLFGKPTVVNNVLTLATVPMILADGAAAYAALGTGRSRGTQVFQLGGNVANGGIVETAFGVTLDQLVNDFGGGTASGRPVRAVQVGGPLGAYLPPELFSLPLDYEVFAANDAMVGHGGIVVFDDTVDMAAQARFAMEFCAIESCGKCTPCRIGSTRGVELIDKIRTEQRSEQGDTDRAASIDLLLDLCEVMADGSLCAMGGLTPMPVRSALTHFIDDFQGDPR